MTLTQHVRHPLDALEVIGSNPCLISKDVINGSYCCCVRCATLRVGGMPWTKTGATYIHAQLGILMKGCPTDLWNRCIYRFYNELICLLPNCFLLLGCVNTQQTIGWFWMTQLRDGTRTVRWGRYNYLNLSPSSVSL